MNEDEVIQRLKTARRELDNLYPVVQMIDDWQFDREIVVLSYVNNY